MKARPRATRKTYTRTALYEALVFGKLWGNSSERSLRGFGERSLRGFGVFEKVSERTPFAGPLRGPLLLENWSQNVPFRGLPATLSEVLSE